LLQDLFKSYQLLERPVFNESEALNVSVGLFLMKIVDVDEKNQIITIQAWLDLVEIFYFGYFSSKSHFNF
jgi:nicotinic acetylcholine receptor